jgi:hypothetical protein
MDFARARTLMVWLAAGIIFDLLLVESNSVRILLGKPAELTGYWLFGIMVFLALFNLRKKLSMLPLGNASTWLLLHAIGGVLAVATFWLHTQSVWPNGIYERALAILFYLTVLSGIVGYIVQRVYPSKLTQTGVEVIYDRIPGHIDELRAKAEALVLKCCDETRVDTLGQHYLDTMEWFFRRPRFGLSHVGGSQRSRQWIRQQDANVRRYLNEEERTYLDQLTGLATQKNRIDVHYALQSVLKRWLVFHIPITVALMTLSVWHLMVVNVYSL